MLQISQTEKPMCSARIDQIRLRRAITFPLASQNASSSGVQSEIQVASRLLIARWPFRSKWLPTAASLEVAAAAPLVAFEHPARRGGASLEARAHCSEPCSTVRRPAGTQRDPITR